MDLSTTDEGEGRSTIGAALSRISLLSIGSLTPDAVFELVTSVAKIAREEEPQRIFDAIAGLLIELGALASAVYVADDEGRRLVRMAGAGALPPVLRRSSLSYDEEAFPSRAATTGEPSFEAAIPGDRDPGAPAPAGLLAIPLHDKGGLLGVVAWSTPTLEPSMADELVGLRVISAIFQATFKSALFEQRIASMIARHREAERQLRKSRESLRLTIQSAPIGMCITSLDGQFLQVNQALAEITGYEPEELLGKRYQSLTHPDDREREAEYMERVIHGGSAQAPFTKRYVRKDGRVVDVELYGGLVRDEAGRPLHFVGQIVDVTERRRMERAREELLARIEGEWTWLSTVIENSPTGIVLMRGEDHLIANSQAESLFGVRFSPTGGIAQFAGRIRSRSGHVVSVGELEAGYLWHKPATREVDILRPDGTDLAVIASSAPILDSAERIIGRVTTFQDVTPLKEMARLKDEWTSIVAHDLRQVVTVITSYTSLLAREATADPMRVRLGHILTNAHHLSRMLSDLLDSSRLDVSEMELNKESTDLCELVRDALERRAGALGDHEVELEAAPSLPPIDVDPGRIEQVVDNLLSNAVKYSYPGSKILVGVERDDDSEEVSVRNEGDGIPAEELPHVFRRFQRSTRVSKIAGLGLGLYISKGLVEAHGGRIWVESVPFRTTTFHFTLPIPGR